MSWMRIIKTNNGTKFYTSDYKSHNNVSDAISYINKNFDRLKEINGNFDINHIRKNKINKIIKKIK